MTKRHLVIATRESPLALKQAELIKEKLINHHPHLSIDFLGITTQADKRLEINLINIGGKGLFVKELEEALLTGRADIAVHSMKDVPMNLPQGLCLPVIDKREDPHDVFISNQYSSLFQLPTGAKVGTSSLRRKTQLRALRADVQFEAVRGNINTRLKRLDRGDFDALVLARAGLKRMGLQERIKSSLSIEECLPAAGQGALGIECREDDDGIKDLIAPLNDLKSFYSIMAERSLCRRLDGGCQMPVGAYAHIQGDILMLKGLVANQQGTRILHARREGNYEHAENIGIRVAEELIAQGADKILREFQ